MKLVIISANKLNFLLVCRGDCGVFTIKYIEMLSSGRQNIVNVGDKFVDEYRKRIADSIFDINWID